MIHSQNWGDMTIPMIQYGPAAAGLLLALGLWFTKWRSQGTASTPARTSTAITMVIALGCMIVFTAWSVFPTWMPPLDEDGTRVLILARYALPLILCISALLVLTLPVRAPRPRGSAELAPRTLMSFAPRSWLVSATATTVGVIIVSILAGLASSPDEFGRYFMYAVEASDNTRASTMIYGWWFSLPCLVLIAIIPAITLIALVVTSRPPLSVDRDGDIAKRTARVRSVMAVGTGGLLLHLGAIFQSLHGASSLRLGFQTEPVGWVELGTSFAAMGPALLILSYISVVLGFAMWWGVLLSALRVRTRQRSESVPA